MNQLNSETDIQKKNVSGAKRKTAMLVAVFVFVGVITVLALALAYPSMRNLANPENALSPSMQKMYRIGQYIVLYAVRNNEAFPERLSMIYGKNYISDINMFSSYATLKTPADIDKNIDFTYIYNPKISDTPAPVLRENSKDGVTMMLSKKGISWKYPEKENPPAANK
ncbi:MAG: hypothetical protein A2017_19850 [Lentisphaerae bacterium GWF2_44_16]|nr:MAG: hypothetical protein A2017_19850 [Lentisphaerae bacterium GWF2_44_16]